MSTGWLSFEMHDCIIIPQMADGEILNCQPVSRAHFGGAVGRAPQVEDLLPFEGRRGERDSLLGERGEQDAVPRRVGRPVGMDVNSDGLRAWTGTPEPVSTAGNETSCTCCDRTPYHCAASDDPFERGRFP
jgi:hypothetical protein